MMILKIKQGETFVLEGQYTEDDGITPKSLTGVTLKSQLRNSKEALIVTLLITITDNNAGTYTLESPVATDYWPIANLHLDILETVNGNTIITNTITLIVEAAMTHR